MEVVGLQQPLLSDYRSEIEPDFKLLRDFLGMEEDAAGTLFHPFFGYNQSWFSGALSVVVTR